jgi:hypothetical protein
VRVHELRQLLAVTALEGADLDRGHGDDLLGSDAIERPATGAVRREA